MGLSPFIKYLKINNINICTIFSHVLSEFIHKFLLIMVNLNDKITFKFEIKRIIDSIVLKIKVIKGNDSVCFYAKKHILEDQVR